MTTEEVRRAVHRRDLLKTTAQEVLRREAIERERDNREAWRVEREKLARADREDLPLID